MADIVNIDDFRPEGSTGPAEVSFIGFRFEQEDGETQRLQVNVVVANGDFEGIINAVRENGGIYVQPNEGEDVAAWFLPWPCAAVRVKPARP